MISPTRATPGGRSPRSAPPRPRLRRSEQVGAALALLFAGAFVGVGAMGLIRGSSPAATIAASASSGDTTGAGETDAIESDVPDYSIAPGSSVLEARMPASVDGVALTVESAIDATSLSSGPDGRALNAAIVHLGKAASDLEIAIAYDDTGSIDLTVLGFRADGISAADIRDAVLSAWLGAATPGVTMTSLSWSGIDVTKVSYGDDGTDEYVVIVSDSVFVLETADPATAQSAAAALVTPADGPASAPTSPGP